MAIENWNAVPENKEKLAQRIYDRAKTYQESGETFTITEYTVIELRL